MICAYCGRSFVATTPEQRFCRRSHAKKYNEKGRASYAPLARRLREPEPASDPSPEPRPGLDLCPRPDKAKVDKATARRLAREAGTRTQGVEAYLCSCGAWHIGHVRDARV